MNRSIEFLFRFPSCTLATADANREIADDDLAFKFNAGTIGFPDWPGAVEPNALPAFPESGLTDETGFAIACLLPVVV
jgi:hypothetical protein